MPLSGGTSGAHDDSMHQGNAKRDTVDGLAGLDSSGYILGKGSQLRMPVNGGSHLNIVDRTSGEAGIDLTRLGASDFTMDIRESGVWVAVQTASMKDVVNGIAALDAAGSLLLPGSKMYFTRDGSDDVHIYERTSDEEAYAFHRVGADDYTFFVKESNVWKQMQTESMKDIANGIAGLDADAKIENAQMAGLYKKYVIGDADLHGDADIKQTTSTTYVKVKTIALDVLYPDPSTLRIYFGIRGYDGNAYGKIYKNGAPVGTERMVAPNGYSFFSEDLSFAEGDTVELWLKMEAGATAAYNTHFWIRGSEDYKTLQEAITDSNVGVADPVQVTLSAP